MQAVPQNKNPKLREPIPHAQWLSIRRWPVLVTAIVIAALFLLISAQLSIGPNWLPIALVGAMLVPISIARVRGHQQLSRITALVVISIVTLALLSSVILLIYSILSKTIAASNLLRDAVLLWSANILTFSIWYWEIDRGGPVPRHMHYNIPPDFLFPQMNLNDAYWANWTPRFIDYIFLAFNHSTAFSPTDTAVLMPRAKLLVMAQASMSLVILAVLATRAINIL